MILRVVDCPEPVTMRVTGPIEHLCPYVYEVDRGEVTIEWKSAPRGLELHSLAEYLGSFADQTLSHEQLADTIRTYVCAALGTERVSVRVTFETAGLTCQVTAE